MHEHHSHEQEHLHDHSHEQEHHVVKNHERLVKDSKIAAWLNLATGFGKVAIGLAALSPVLVTDGAHDFGDFDTYLSDAKAIQETDPQLKAKRKIRAGFKLGGYAVAGTIFESVIEQTVKHAPIPMLSLVGSLGSIGFNWLIHKRFSHHHDEEADEVKSHGELDLWTSAITIGASIASFVWLPALLVGSFAHIALYSNQARKTYGKFKHQARGSASPAS